MCQRSRGNPLLSLDYKDSDIVIFLTLMKIIKDELWPWPIEILMLLNTYIVWLFSLELRKNTKESKDDVVKKEKINEKY